MSAIIVDLETLVVDATPTTDPANPPTGPTAADAPARFTRADSRAEWSADPANREEWWRDGSLTWDRSRIGCVGLYHEASGPVVYDCEEMGEAIALRGLGHDLEAASEVWAFGTFDARILRSRYLAHRMPIPRPLRIGAKPWDRTWRDLQAVAAECLTGRASEIRGISVDAVCRHLGIERAPSTVDGAGVLDAYLSGRWGLVIEHCRADVVDEWAILGRMRGVL
jgi:hypothetical protein